MNECQLKFEKVLNSFLIPKCHIANDVYLEMLITHLSGKKDCEYTELLRSQVVFTWLEKAVSQWSTDNPPNPLIVAFTLKLLSLIIENEWQFATIKDKQILENIQQILVKNENLQNPSIKLAYVTLLSSISTHTIGLHWIKQTKSWKTVIEYCQKNHTVYVLREGLQFIYNILHKFASLMNDDQLCIEILSDICLPLSENLWKNLENTTVALVDDSELQQKLIPTLNIICFILQKSVESNDSTKISYHILETYKLESQLWRLANITHDHPFLGKLFRCFVLANFSRLIFTGKLIINDTHKDVDFNKFGVNYFNYMNFSIARRCSRNILMMAELNQMLWKTLGSRAPSEVVLENQMIKFEDQLIILHVIPILYVIKSRKPGVTECLDNYIMKLFNISCEHTTRLCYAFRDLLMTMDQNVSELACLSIQGVLSMKNTLHRDRAVIIFQALVYTLKEFAPDGCFFAVPVAHTHSDLLNSPNLLSAILNGLYSLIKNYHITWKECIESTTMVNFMLALLGNPNLPPRIAVQALKLAQLSIEHFLAPNLALLVDTVQGSGMENLGPMILKRLHDNNWEIRDSALELLASMTTISEIKFPAFQQHIFESGICPVVTALAKNDSEPYVRASALCCLCPMVKIKYFWEKFLHTEDLLIYLLSVLCKESEGVVRSEAVALITEIYQHQQVPRENLEKLYTALAHCAINDLYWEVKLKALLFWKVVMCRQFQHQGMIDGTFPTVTFSKEHRKIVTLTDKEILLRISKVLYELSLRGCLGVLLFALDDECDLEVVKGSVEIAKKLMKFLEKYDYMNHRSKDGAKESVYTKRPIIDTNYSEIQTISNYEQKLRDENKESFLSKKPNNNTDNSEMHTSSIADDCSTRSKPDRATIELSVCAPTQVIESIVESDDINLLAAAYENQMQVCPDINNATNNDIFFDETIYQRCVNVTPDEFLNKISQMDFDNILKSKMDWITHTESFDSLLDDILYSVKDFNVNSADCY